MTLYGCNIRFPSRNSLDESQVVTVVLSIIFTHDWSISLTHNYHSPSPYKLGCKFSALISDGVTELLKGKITSILLYYRCTGKPWVPLEWHQCKHCHRCWSVWWTSSVLAVCWSSPQAALQGSDIITDGFNKGDEPQGPDSFQHVSWEIN